MSRELKILEKLEKEINLKELQIKSLLTITQAINDNVNAEDLFQMYRSFLSWEMGIKKMILYIREESSWKCVSHINGEFVNHEQIIDEIKPIKRLFVVKEEESPTLRDYDIIIPVYHKDFPIAYSLIGGIKDKEDLYNKIQFITTITNIIAVAIENKRLFNQQITQERIKKDMELAREVQKMLIPQSAPSSAYFDLDYVYQPHSSIGGDYIDFIQFGEKRVCACIADISGKGVAAALLMANFQAMLQSLIYQYRDLETFIYALNEAVYRITQSDRFITFFIAEIDAEKKQMRYINAGHYPPYLWNKGELSELKDGTTVIGAFDKLPEIKETIIDLEHEAMLFCFTDGLPDLKNEDDDYFDDETIQQFIMEHHELDTKAFNSQLMERLSAHKGKGEFIDDIAILTCKLL